MWPKLRTQTVKLLEMTGLKWLYQYVEKQHYSSIQTWHIADLRFEITFVMPRCVWPHLYEWTESNKCIYVYLTTCKKSTSYLHSLLRHSWLTIWHQFGHVQTYLTTHSYNNWVDLLLLRMPNHIHHLIHIGQEVFGS